MKLKIDAVIRYLKKSKNLKIIKMQKYIFFLKKSYYKFKLCKKKYVTVTIFEILIECSLLINNTVPIVI